MCMFAILVIMITDVIITIVALDERNVNNKLISIKRRISGFTNFDHFCVTPARVSNCTSICCREITSAHECSHPLHCSNGLLIWRKAFSLFMRVSPASCFCLRCVAPRPLQAARSIQLGDNTQGFCGWCCSDGTDYYKAYHSASGRAYAHYNLHNDGQTMVTDGEARPGCISKVHPREGEQVFEVLCRHDSYTFGDDQRCHPHPSLTRDGRQVIFTSNRTSTSNIYLTDWD